MWAKVADFLRASHGRLGWNDNSGSTASEYALIGTGIAVAIIGALFLIGDEINRLFDVIQTTLANSSN